MSEAASFFTDGEAYERFMGRWSRSAGQVFTDWLAPPPGLRWLDVGCGTGAYTELVLERCAPATIDAVDPAEDQIGYARGRPAAARVSYRVGDAQSLPYADNAFDVAVMALVITFVPDPAKAVGEMARVVRPGGTVAAYIWDFAGGGFPQQPLLDALQAVGVTVPSQPGHANASFDALTGFFQGAGLEDIARRVIDVEVSYASFDDYWASQTGLPNPAVQVIRKMSASEVERLKAHLRGHLPADGSGRIAYPAWANAVRGRVPR